MSSPPQILPAPLVMYLREYDLPALALCLSLVG